MKLNKYLLTLLTIAIASSVAAQSKRQLQRQLDASQTKVEQLEIEVNDLRERLTKTNDNLKKALETNATQMDANATLTATNTDLLRRLNLEKSRSGTGNRQIDSLVRLVNLLQLDTDFVINPRNKQDSIIAVLQPFYAARIWEDRLDYVLEPNKMKAAMVRHYNDYPVRAIIKPGQVTFLKVDSLDMSLQKVGIGNNIIYLRKQNNSYKMDWAASHGLNQMPPTLFKETKSEEPMAFRVIATLSKTYLAPYANKKNDYWSVELQTIFPKETFNAYVLKDSEEGRAIHALIEDGTSQRMIVKMLKDQEDKTGNVTRITEFIQEDWSKK